MLIRNMINKPYWTFTKNFGEFDRLMRDMNRLFYGGSEFPSRLQRSGVFPAINLTQDTVNYCIRAELPGLKSEDLSISAEDNSITISGERKISTEEGVKYHRSERDAGKFSRVLNMPGEIDADKIEAKLNNGILTIVIPKAEKAKPRQISVK